MLTIGERINGMYRAVKRAIKNKDADVIKQLAVKQVEGGANMLDVNTGPAAADPVEVIGWLVETIHEAVDVPLAIDSPKPEVIEVGLKSHKKGKPMINSTTAEVDKLTRLLDLALEHNASVIGLSMDEHGVPRDVNRKSELALQIVAMAMEKGFPLDDLYLDPLILPVNVEQAHCLQVLESLRQFKLLSDPPPRTVIGLSNVSQRTQERELINRTFLVMAMACGLDAAIVDSTDESLMDAMITADLLLNKNIYCDSYLDAYRKSG